MGFVIWLYCTWASRRLEVPFRETPGMSLADLEELANTEDKNLPGFLTFYSGYMIEETSTE